MKVLIYCCSVYQVFNAIHLAAHVLDSDTVDIMISDYLPDAEKTMKGLEKSGLFHKVILVRSKEIAKQNYKHTRFTVYAYRLLPHLILKQAELNHVDRYDRFYFATYDDYISFLFLALRKKNPQLKCFCFEDGGSTYMRTFRTVNSVEKRLYRWFRILPLGMADAPLLVYEPSLVTFDCGTDVLSMPKISREDKSFIAAVNTAFGIEEIDAPEKPVIFFEESFAADGLKNNDRELIELCNTICSGEMMLKLHPRNGVNRFAKSNIAILHSNVPWEVFCLNVDLSEHTLVTINSNAAISPHIIFDKAPKSILLFNMLVGESFLRGKPEYDLYYEKLLVQFPREISAPQSEEELKRELNR